jgi:DNA gyrase subunit B
MCKPIIIHEDNGEQKLDLAFIYDSGGKDGPDPNEKITAFCNMCPTTGGTHIDGVVDGITKWFVSYMNNIYLSNQKAKIKTKVNASDIKNGLHIMISAASLEPIFTGQAKEILSNEEMLPFVKDVVSKNLDEWSKSNPQDLFKLSKYFKDLADLRMKSEGEKVKIATKYEQNSLTGLPAKFAKPTEEEYEFIIVEGDSAGGSAKVGRDEKRQGIFPIRGKISSAFEKSYKDFWDNPETQGIARIILGHPWQGKNSVKIEDVKWDKIIFMADADVDGSHIASLLLRFFILYMPQLIQAGKVYKALPPLYSIKNGQKLTYFTDQIDFVRYVQKSFIQSNSLSTKSGLNLSGKDITILFMTNEDYVFEIERLAHTYAVDPQLLEMALYGYFEKTPLSKLKKELKSEFRFMDVEKVKDFIIYQGTIKESNLLFMNQRLVTDCKRALDIIQKNRELYYKMNGKTVGLYKIMKAFEQSTPSNIQRYKGLGEMNADQIAVSTLRPDSDRTLIRYTLEDAKEELEIIRNYESDRSKLLQFVGTVKRSDLLD